MTAQHIEYTNHLLGMKKDIHQLIIIPAIIFGMLGYLAAISLLNFFINTIGLHLQLISLSGLEKFRLSIASLMFLIPPISYLLFRREFGADTDKQPISRYIRNLIMLLLAGLVGVCLDIISVKLFEDDVNELSGDVPWTSFLENLSPFISGIGVMLLMAAFLFLWVSRAKSSQKIAE